MDLGEMKEQLSEEPLHWEDRNMYIYLSANF